MTLSFDLFDDWRFQRRRLLLRSEKFSLLMQRVMMRFSRDAEDSTTCIPHYFLGIL